MQAGEKRGVPSHRFLPSTLVPATQVYTAAIHTTRYVLTGVSLPTHTPRLGTVLRAQTPTVHGTDLAPNPGGPRGLGARVLPTAPSEHRKQAACPQIPTGRDRLEAKPASKDRLSAKGYFLTLIQEQPVIVLRGRCPSLFKDSDPFKANDKRMTALGVLTRPHGQDPKRQALAQGSGGIRGPKAEARK